MDDENTDREGVRRVETQTSSRWWTIFAAGLLVAFLLGLVPMWLAKRSVNQDLATTNRELRRLKMQSSLSAAAVYARRGEYETARQNASDFYTELQAEVNAAESQTLTAPERTQAPSLLSSRDEIVTLLSRADPASAERISNLYVDYRSATGGAHR